MTTRVAALIRGKRSQTQWATGLRQRRQTSRMPDLYTACPPGGQAIGGSARARLARKAACGLSGDSVGPLG
jgi:hypothetical protein